MNANTNTNTNNDIQGQNAQAYVNYQLVRGGNPQILIDPDGEVGKRIEPEFDNREVTLHDIRGGQSPRFDRHGFAFVHVASQVTDFDEQQQFRTQYDAEIEHIIKDLSGATEVVIFDHTVRTDGDSIRRPARHVHGDYSAISGHTRLHELLGDEKAGEWEKGHYGIINVWRPVTHPVQTAPLVFADPMTVDNGDWTDIDMVYPDRQGQITGLTYNPAHRWVYQSNMTPDETVVFTTFDNVGEKAVAHTAADLVRIPDNATPRKSIETRALVRFEK